MKKSKFIWFFIIFFHSLGFTLPLRAWNEDYNPEKTPSSRTVCVKNIENIKKENVSVRSIQSDESCAESEERDLLIIGKEPKGSMAFIPILTKTKYYPNWVVAWPPKDQKNPQLWHFTCLKAEPIVVLGVETKKFKHMGEITSPLKNQSCALALLMAKEVCNAQLKGDEIFERCSSFSNLIEF